ncbi:MAG: hypothetical protein LBF58_09570 [Deltaproteobacteria bacterium]|jgi:hypothetical protein|nr:hypothetical protein [Deltaproteobacteria bacterium]
MVIVFATCGLALAQANKKAKVVAIGKHEDGIICQYIASEKKDVPDVVSVRMDTQTFNFYNGLQIGEQYDQLGNLPVGSPIKFDFSVLEPVGEPEVLSAAPKTNVVIHKLHGAGDPDPSLCEAMGD